MSSSEWSEPASARTILPRTSWTGAPESQGSKFLFEQVQPALCHFIDPNFRVQHSSVGGSNDSTTLEDDLVWHSTDHFAHKLQDHNKQHELGVHYREYFFGICTENTGRHEYYPPGFSWSSHRRRIKTWLSLRVCSANASIGSDGFHAAFQARHLEQKWPCYNWVAFGG